jgi:hypothetical protein
MFDPLLYPSESRAHFRHSTFPSASPSDPAIRVSSPPPTRLKHAVIAAVNGIYLLSPLPSPSPPLSPSPSISLPPSLSPLSLSPLL